MNEQKPPSKGNLQVLWGFLTGLGIILIGGLLTVGSGSPTVAVLPLAVYVFAVYRALKKDTYGFLKGLLLAVAVGVLLVSACFGVVIYMLTNH